MLAPRVGRHQTDDDPNGHSCTTRGDSLESGSGFLPLFSRALISSSGFAFSAVARKSGATGPGSLKSRSGDRIGECAGPVASTTHNKPVNCLLEFEDVPRPCVGLEPGNHVWAELDVPSIPAVEPFEKE